MSEARPRRPSKPDRRKGEAARYKQAAEEALRQVDFCVSYLRRIQKRRLAARLAQNRDLIARRWLRKPRRSSTRRRQAG